MNSEKFSFKKLNDYIDNDEIKKARKYISKHFIPCTNSSHILNENNEFTIIQGDVFNKVYLNRFGPQIKKWYMTKTIPKDLICDMHKPIITDDYINISPRLMHQYKKYNTFNKDIQSKVKIFLDYIKLIWANNNEEVHKYILKWLGNMIQGLKNKTCLYAKGPEGIGKSTLIDIIMYHVLGLKLCTKGQSDQLKGNNMKLMGKLFVPFEELPVFSDKEWHSIDSNLKDMITSEISSYVDKYEKRIDAENKNNYIVCTNFNAIKGAHGRRYFVIPLNCEKQNDFKYWENIRKNCYNNEVGHAIYCYLCEIDIKGFNALNMPDTTAKLDIIVENMLPIEKFLKQTYILKKTGINEALKTAYEKYQNFCSENKNRFHIMSIQTFNKTLKEYNIINNLRNGNNWLNIKFEFLDELAKRKKWYHELDNIAYDKNDDIDYIDNKNNIDYSIKQDLTINDIFEKINNYEEELKKLREQLINKIDIENDYKPKKIIKKVIKIDTDTESDTDTDSESDINSDFDSDFDINGDDKFTIDFSMI
jgi:hypothetical protein